jgi:hypothetical protein
LIAFAAPAIVPDGSRGRTNGWRSIEFTHESKGTRRHGASARRPLWRGDFFAQTVGSDMPDPKLRDVAASVGPELLSGRDAVLEEAGKPPYSEETFRYLLSVERKRSERSRRSLLLLLVRFKRQQPDDRIEPGVASALFSGLKVCVREIDFFGWYQTGRVAGAVLPQRGEVPSWDACRGIVERAMQTLADHLPAPEARRLRVRVIEVRPRTRI